MEVTGRLLAVITLGVAALTACATTPGISEADYHTLSRVMDAMDQQRDDDARQALGPLLSSPNAYTRAIAHQTLGFLESRQERHQAAVSAFQAAIDTAALKPEVNNQMLHNIGHASLLAHDCAGSVSAFERWRVATGNPYDKAAATDLALCHAEQGRFDEAVAMYALASQSVEDPSAAWRKVGSDLSLAKQGTRFPERHFIRTLNDETYFRTRPVRKEGACALQRPAEYKDRSVDGTIIVALSVDAKGTPSGARVTKTDLPDVWNAAAIDTVMKCKWKPALDDGTPVKAETTITFRPK